MPCCLTRTVLRAHLLTALRVRTPANRNACDLRPASRSEHIRPLPPSSPNNCLLLQVRAEYQGTLDLVQPLGAFLVTKADQYTLPQMLQQELLGMPPPSASRGGAALNKQKKAHTNFRNLKGFTRVNALFKSVRPFCLPTCSFMCTPLSSKGDVPLEQRHCAPLQERHWQRPVQVGARTTCSVVGTTLSNRVNALFKSVRARPALFCAPLSPTASTPYSSRCALSACRPALSCAPLSPAKVLSLWNKGPVPLSNKGTGNALFKSVRARPALLCALLSPTASTPCSSRCALFARRPRATCAFMCTTLSNKGAAALSNNGAVPLANKGAVPLSKEAGQQRKQDTISMKG